MNKYQKKLIIIGDSGVYGWGDLEGGGWCERLSQWFKDEGDVIILLGDLVNSFVLRSITYKSLASSLWPINTILLSLGCHDVVNTPSNAIGIFS